MNLVTEQGELTDGRTEILLKEYEVCITDAHELEQLIWTTASILVPASIAGIVYLSAGMVNSISRHQFLAQTGVAVFAIIFTWQWSQMVRRWYSYQSITYYRVLEIERELGMYKERYAQAIKDFVDQKGYEQDPLVSKMVTAMRPQFYKVSVTKTVRGIGPLLTVAWILVIIMQSALALKWL